MVTFDRSRPKFFDSHSFKKLQTIQNVEIDEQTIVCSEIFDSD